MRNVVFGHPGRIPVIAWARVQKTNAISTLASSAEESCSHRTWLSRKSSEESRRFSFVTLSFPENLYIISKIKYLEICAYFLGI
jgi:hypothetical protein